MNADVFDYYKVMRNLVSELGREETLHVVWAYTQFLQLKDFQIPNDINVRPGFLHLNPPQKWIAEWEMEVIAKESIINSGVVPRRGRTIRDWGVLAKILNSLKQLEDQIFGLQPENSSILIELNRIAHRQFTWQANKPNATGIVRYLRVFDTPEINEICIRQLGIPVRTVFICGVSLIGHFLSNSAINLPITSSIEGIDDKAIERFLDFTTIDVSRAKSVFASEQKFDSRFIYAYTSLRAFPLLRTQVKGKRAIMCPIPTLLYWRFTNGLYYSLIGDAHFGDMFGKSFQKYVGEVAERTTKASSIEVIAETSYGTKARARDSVDWILAQDGFALFLECKAKRLSWGAKAAIDDIEPIKQDIRRLAEAVAQTYKTLLDYLDGQYPHFGFDPNRKIYVAIVTLENWYMFGPKMPELLRDAVFEVVQREGLDTSMIEKFPYTVIPVSDLETGLQFASRVGLAEFWLGKYQDAEMNQWDWWGYIREKFGGTKNTTPIFMKEYEDFFSDVRSIGTS